MNRDELNDLLADYLGNELPPAERQRFEASLAADPAFAEEVAALRHTLVTLRSLDDPSRVACPSPDADRGAGMLRPVPVYRFRSAAAFQLPSLMRYAAAILLAFAAGYAAKSLAPAAVPPALTAPPQDGAKPPSDFERRFAEAYGRSSADSELARSLIALSRATH